MTTPQKSPLHTRQAERERWGRIHIQGDHNPPIELSDRRKRQPSGTSKSIRQFGRKESAVYE